MAKGQRSIRTLRSTIARRPITRWLALALLAAMPVSVYAAAVGGLTTFVNGTIADADQMNANFAAVETAVDDNDARLVTLEAIPDQQCPSGEYATGIDANGNLVCGAPPTPASPIILSTPIPDPWLEGQTISTPACPDGRQLVGAAIGNDAGVCGLISNRGYFLALGGGEGGGAGCTPRFPQGGTLSLSAPSCACFAFCE